MSKPTPPLPVRRFGPLFALYCELRRRLPQILVAHVRGPQGYVRVTYRDAGPADPVWDKETREYQWSSDPTTRVGSDIDEVIQNVAAFLGAVATGGRDGA